MNIKNIIAISFCKLMVNIWNYFFRLHWYNCLYRHQCWKIVWWDYKSAPKFLVLISKNISRPDYRYPDTGRYEMSSRLCGSCIDMFCITGWRTAFRTFQHIVWAEQSWDVVSNRFTLFIEPGLLSSWCLSLYIISLNIMKNYFLPWSKNQLSWKYLWNTCVLHLYRYSSAIEWQAYSFLSSQRNSWWAYKLHPAPPKS